MSSNRFDDLAKAMATGASRRSILKGVAGVVAGGVLAGIAGRQASTISAQAGCPTGGTCKACGSSGTQTRHLGEACSASQRCIEQEHLVCQKVAETGAHRCECGTGFVRCGSQCLPVTCPGGAVSPT